MIKNKTSNLGMTLEKDINLTNSYYLVNNIAVVFKKPTPIQIVRVSYPSRSKSKITEAYYKTPSTTDYNGIFKGKYIDFDVKETMNKTSYPLSNIQNHQVKHLKMIHDHGGIAFLIVHFKVQNIYFYLSYEHLSLYWDNKKDGRKSIPFDYFINNCYEITFSYNPRLDYLKVIDKLYF